MTIACPKCAEQFKSKRQLSAHLFIPARCEARLGLLRLEAAKLQPISVRARSVLSPAGLKLNYVTTGIDARGRAIATDVAPAWAAMLYTKLTQYNEEPGRFTPGEGAWVLNLEPLPDHDDAPLVSYFAQVIARVAEEPSFAGTLTAICRLSTNAPSIEAWLAEQGIE